MSVEDYLIVYEDFVRGNYEFGVVKNKEIAKNHIKDGKKMVFQTRKEFEKIFLCGMIFFLILALFIQFFVDVFYPVDIITWIVCGVMITACFVLRVWFQKQNEFYILGAEGICYKKKWIHKEPQFLSWNQVIDIEVLDKLFKMSDIDDINKTRVPYKDIRLNGQNGLLLEISTFNFEFSEFPKKLDFQEQISLFVYVVREYCDNQKKKEELF